MTDLIASDVDDYARIATRMALEPEVRDAMRGRILENVHKLFKQDAAVQAWSTLPQLTLTPTLTLTLALTLALTLTLTGAGVEHAAAAARRAADRRLRGRRGLATPSPAPGTRKPQEEEVQKEATGNRQGGAVASHGERAKRTASRCAYIELYKYI